MAGRLERVRAEIEKRGAEALLITEPVNVRYLTGFTGSNAFLLLTGRSAHLLTDSRYTLQARSEVGRPWRVRIYKDSVFKELASIAAKEGVKVLGFEGCRIAFDTVGALRRVFKGVKLRSLGAVVESARVVKDRFEIASIRSAIELSEKGFKAARRVVRAGGTERDVALAIERAVKRGGADSLSFETIVLAGRRGALPHGKPSGKVIKAGQLVVVDMGVFKGGYASDETRTLSVGRATKKQKDIYGIVKEAHDRAIAKVAPGVVASEVDRAARDCIKRAGYGRWFGHGTGHGVGLEIHEGPTIGPKSETVLEEGMVFTVEPGIYIPGWGGVRIEDMVLVTAEGCEALTSLKAKEFKSIV